MFVLIDELEKVGEDELADKINRFTNLNYSVKVEPEGRISTPLGKRTIYSLKVFKWVENE